MKRKSYVDDASLEKALGDSSRLKDAPEAVIQRAIQLMQAVRPEAALTATPSGPVRAVLAMLRFDSASASPLAFGQRSRGSAVRQLLYAVNGRDVDIRVAPSGEGTYGVSGQVLGPDTEGQVKLARRDTGEQFSCSLSELGEFRIKDLHAGSYQLVLDLHMLSVALPDLTIPHDNAGD